MSILPTMPSDEVQTTWNGATGHALLRQSVAFIRTVIGSYHAITQRSILEATALDFGCGWGRLTRLLYKYIPYDRIWAVDPWDRSIEMCQECSVLGNLAISDWIPRSLPVDGRRFDLIIAFSVFTHLSEKVANIAARTLRGHLTDDGLIAMTIRPVEYWHHYYEFAAHGLDPKVARPQVLRRHHEYGFAFLPHNGQKIEGEVTYGDTSMTLEYIETNFEGLRIRAVDWHEIDPVQLIVFLGRDA